MRQHNGVRRAACGVLLAAVLGCSRQSPEQASPAPTAPLPTAGLAGQKVAITPLTLVGAEDTLGWDALMADRRGTLSQSDSVIATLLAARAPEVTWAPPAELRRAARRAVGIATDPDQMGTAFLRAEELVQVPDPLRHQLRTLAGLVGTRYVLVPAALVYRRSNSPTVATAELSVVLIDTRVGRIGWRTIARGDGEDPWAALTRAVKNLTPGLP